jgi:hypothetical protein
MPLVDRAAQHLLDNTHRCRAGRAHAVHELEVQPMTTQGRRDLFAAAMHDRARAVKTTHSRAESVQKLWLIDLVAADFQYVHKVTGCRLQD